LQERPGGGFRWGAGQVRLVAAGRSRHLRCQWIGASAVAVPGATMDPWHQFWTQFFFKLSDILPYFAAGAAAVIAVSLTPLGRALARYLREANRTQALPPAMEEALGSLRADTAEILERIDFLERAVAQERLKADPAAPALPPPPPTGRIVTPA